MRRQVRVCCRIPDIEIDAVEDTAELVPVRLQDPLHAITECRGADLLCVGRADGGYGVGIDKPRFQHREAAVELDTIT